MSADMEKVRSVVFDMEGPLNEAGAVSKVLRLICHEAKAAEDPDTADGLAWLSNQLTAAMQDLRERWDELHRLTSSTT